MTVAQRVPQMACGCEDPDAGRSLISINEALARIATRFDAVPATERVALHAARGRVLADPIDAKSDMPRFDHAAMDGYAIRRADLTGAGPWQLLVSLRCAAGDGRRPVLPKGTAARIFTGAPIPRGADCVIMQEDVDRNEGVITVAHRPTVRANIRFRGEEHRAGSPILAPGARMTVRAIAAAVAGGHGEVVVRRPLRVSLLASGAEIVSPGSPSPTEGAIWDVNTPMLRAALTRGDVELVKVGAIPDDAAKSRAALAEAARDSDLIVTTGGVSVGEEDHLRQAVRDLAGAEVFAGVAMKPGKPVSCGQINGAAWLGLPGNPQSAFVAWTLFGTALVQQLTGLTKPDTLRRHVVLSHTVRRKPGRCELRAATVVGCDGLGREMVSCNSPVRSGQVSALGAADGLVFLPAEVEKLPQAALVEFLPFCRD